MLESEPRDWGDAAYESYRQQFYSDHQYPYLPQDLVASMPENAFHVMQDKGIILRIDRREVGGNPLRAVFMDAVRIPKAALPHICS